MADKAKQTPPVVGHGGAAEQKLKAELGIWLGIVGMIARGLTSRDPTAGAVIAQALSDITTIHWDRYHNLYHLLKGDEPPV